MTKIYDIFGFQFLPDLEPSRSAILAECHANH